LSSNTVALGGGYAFIRRFSKINTLLNYYENCKMVEEFSTQFNVLYISPIEAAGEGHFVYIYVYIQGVR